MNRSNFHVLLSIIAGASISACSGESSCSNAGSGGVRNMGTGGMSAGCTATSPQTIALVSDDSWRTYGADEGEEPPSGWNTPSFDDRTWSASVAPNPGACGSYEPTQSWERPNQPMWDVSNEYSAFFRKLLFIPEDGAIQDATITSFADDDIAIWVNGNAAFIEPNFGVVEGGTIMPNVIDLKPFLEPGENLIAIHAQDTIGGCRWAVVSGSIEVVHAR